MTPGHGAITHNLGVLAAAQGKHADAIGHFDAAIAAEPRYASAHYNRAAALEACGRTRDAIQGYSRACAIEPEHYGSHRALGLLWLARANGGARSIILRAPMNCGAARIAPASPPRR